MVKKILSLYFILFVVLSNAAAQSIKFDWVEPTCPNPGNGELTITVSGMPGITFDYYLSSTTSGKFPSIPTTDSTYTFTGLGDDIFVAYVNDFATSLTILEKVETKILKQKPYSAELEKLKDAGCHSEPVGAIRIDTIIGGIPPYSITWEDHDPTNDPDNYGTNMLILNLEVGSYTATITDSIGCKIKSDTMEIVPAELVAYIDSIANIKCKGELTGFALAAAANAMVPLKYEWFDSYTGNPHTALPAGKNHWVFITDAFLCTDTAYFEITEPEEGIELTVDRTVDVLCKGLSTGEAYVTAKNGIGEVTFLWSDGGTSKDRTDLAAGTHTVIATDENGCTATQTITINEPPTEIVGKVDEWTMPNCFGGADGSAKLSATGGTPPHAVDWGDLPNDTTRTDFIRNDLKQGTYNIVFKDNLGCESSVTLTVSEPPELILDIVNDPDGTAVDFNLPCFGDSIKVQVKPTGGTPPYTDFIWDNGLPNSDKATLYAGKVYNLTVTDDKGCEVSAVYNPVSPPELLGNPTVSDPIDCYNEKGILKSLQTGGMPPYKYEWSDGSKNSITNPLAAGKYWLKITDANGCENIDTVELTQPDSIKLKILLEGVVCQDISKGTLIVQAIGGTVAKDYKYNWNSGDTNDTITGLAAQMYTVTVTDDNGCSATDSLDLTNINNFEVDFAVSEVTCTNRTDGEITATAVGGNPPFVYEWAHDASAPTTITNLAEGWYKMTITDDFGCQVTDSVYLNTINPMLVSDKGITEANCNVADGSAWVEIAGGTKPYNYLWSNGETADSITNLKVDFYSVEITDDNGCKISTTLKVKDTSDLYVKIVPDDRRIRCKNGATGRAVATAYLGTAPYTFEWSNSTTSDTLKNATAGAYSVRTFDANMCQNIDTVSFVEQNVLEAIITDSTMISCNGLNNGVAVASVQGGVSPFSLEWTDGTKSYVNSNLTPGWHFATITDKAGCVAKDSVNITEPAALSAIIDNVKGISCGAVCDGSARILMSGGTVPYSYKWTSGETDSAATTLCGGKNYIEVVDANSCIYKDSVEIVDTVSRIGLDMFVKQPTVCGLADGEVAVTPFGGIKPYTYLWSTGATDSLITNVKAGGYNLTVTDVAGCSLDTVLILDDNTLMTVAVERWAITDATLCNNPCNQTYGAKADLGVAPYSYVWSNGDKGQKADSLCAQQYFVTAEDANSCKKSQIVDVTAVAMEVNLVSQKNVLCNGASTGEIEVLASNGISSNYIYNWSNSATGAKITGLAAGEYEVTVTEDSNLVCPIKEKYTITEKAELQAFFVTDKPSYCKDSTGKLHVEVLGGTAPYSYLWENGDADDTLNNAWPEYVQIIITDANSCVTIDSGKVDDISDFSLFEKGRYLISCVGDSDGKLEVGLTNGYSPFTYEWTHDVAEVDSLAQNLAPGFYSVTVTDSKNCKQTYDFAEMLDAVPMKFVFSEPDPIFCNNGTGTLQVDVYGGFPNYVFSWTHNANPLSETSNTVESTPAGDYTVSAIDSRGCKSDTSAYTMLDPAPVTATFDVKLSGCGDDENTGEIHLLTLNGPNPPYKFRWHDELVGETTWFDDNKNRSRTNVEAGEHFFTVYDKEELCPTVFKNYTYPESVVSVKTKVNSTHCNFYTEDEIANKKPDGSIEITEITTHKGNPNDTLNKKTYTLFDEFKFQWEDPYAQTTYKAENLPMGEHFVNVAFANQCVSRVSAGTIQARANLNITVETVEDAIKDRKVICFGDSLELKARAYETYNEGYSPASTEKSFFWWSKERNTLADFTSPKTQQTWAKSLGKYYADSSLVVGQYTMDGCTSPEGLFSISHYDSIGFAIEMYDDEDMLIDGDSAFAIQKFKFSLQPIIEPWFFHKDSTIDGYTSINWSSLDETKQRQGQLEDTVTNESTYAESGEYGQNLVAIMASYYIAEATTINGCKEKDVVYMHVYQDLFVPSGITPNGDGDNDVWVIPYLFSCPDAVVQVFNRWGSKIYESEGIYYKNPWDGTNKQGKQVPIGTYYYLIEYNDENGSEPKAGSITVLY